jgi:hypothetical protein
MNSMEMPNQNINLDLAIEKMKEVTKGWAAHKPGEVFYKEEKEVAEMLEFIDIPEDRKEEFVKVAEAFIEQADNQNVIDAVRVKIGLEPVNPDELPL